VDPKSSFRFGHAPPIPESAKESIFPRNVPTDSVEAKELYKKTHGSTQAGEMYTRNYKYPPAVTETGGRHKFGFMDFKDSNLHGLGVKTALTQDAGNDLHCHRPTKIVEGTLAHFQELTRDQLGTSRSLLQSNRNNPNLPDGHSYGKPSEGKDTSAGAVMRGWYKPEEQQPDDDLGRCTARGRRNYLSQEPLGVPTVRSDVKTVPRHMRSLLCTTHYGDDDEAVNLLYPGKFDSKGVNDEDFYARRPREELVEILKGMHREVPPEVFEELFQSAKDLHGDSENTCSLEAILAAVGNRAAAQAV